MTASATIALSLLRPAWPHSLGGQVVGLAAPILNVLFQERLAFSQARTNVGSRIPDALHLDAVLSGKGRVRFRREWMVA